MAFQIKWTENALEDYKYITEYLLANWSIQVALDFENLINKKLSNLSVQPYMGIASNKNPSVRSILITKHNRLFYRITFDAIELLNIFDTRQHPDKNPF